MAFVDKSRVEPTIFFIEKSSFSLKLFSGHFYGQSFIKTVRGPLSDTHPRCKELFEQNMFSVSQSLVFCLRNDFDITIRPRNYNASFKLR